MEGTLGLEQHVFRLKLDRSGRVVVPQPVREKLHLTSGDDVMMIQDGDTYRFETPEQSLRKAQAYFSNLVPEGVSVVDELLAERRAEAVRE